MDPTVCAGSTNFSGQRSRRRDRQGRLLSPSDSTSYGNEERVKPVSAQVHVAVRDHLRRAASSTPLALGETVDCHRVAEDAARRRSQASPTSSENDRPVGACPPPPPRRRRRPRPPAGGLAVRNSRAPRSSSCCKSGWTTHVTINQPGTVIQDLYLHTAPCRRSPRSKHKPQAAPALLLARGIGHSQAARHGRRSLMQLTGKGRTCSSHAQAPK